MLWDPTYILVIIGALISAAASLNVNQTYLEYSRVYSSKGMTAEAVASLLLQRAGIFDVRIERISGSLTDHYSPKEKVLRLSDSVYGSTSVAAIGVAAHECGHAIQHQVDYFPLKLRSASVPLANIGSSASWIVIVLGLVFDWAALTQLGVFLFAFVVLFQLITLPVEFNASSRALGVLRDQALLTDSELDSAQKVLKAAALTYVAALFTSILQLLRLLLLTRRNDRNR